MRVILSWGLLRARYFGQRCERGRRGVDQGTVGRYLEWEPNGAGIMRVMMSGSGNGMSSLSVLWRVALELGTGGGQHSRRAVRLTLNGELMSIGHDAQRLQTELGYLIKHGCIVAEHQKDTLMSLDDLVRISPSGIVHLKLLNDPSYLAACSEDTWVTSQPLAESVADRIARFGPKVHFMRTTMYANASDFVEYLAGRVKDEVARPDSFLESVPADTATLIETVRAALNEKYRRLDEKCGWTDFEKRFPVGAEFSGKIQGIKGFGTFIELDDGHVGLLHVSSYPSSDFPRSANVGARVLVRIQRVQRESRKLALSFVKYWTDS